MKIKKSEFVAKNQYICVLLKIMIVDNFSGKNCSTLMVQFGTDRLSRFNFFWINIKTDKHSISNDKSKSSLNKLQV